MFSWIKSNLVFLTERICLGHGQDTFSIDEKFPRKKMFILINKKMCFFLENSMLLIVRTNTRLAVYA